MSNTATSEVPSSRIVSLAAAKQQNGGPQPDTDTGSLPVSGQAPGSSYGQQMEGPAQGLRSAGSIEKNAWQPQSRVRVLYSMVLLDAESRQAVWDR